MTTRNTAPNRSSAARVARTRAKLRAAGLRPVQIWVPDTRSPGFAAECARQSRLVAEADERDGSLDFWEAAAALDDNAGDIVTIADRGGEFTGKPRPAVVLQSDVFVEAPTVAVLPITSQATDAPLLRIPLGPDDGTGLAVPSWAQVELIATVRRRRVGGRIGRADDATMLAINRALAVFLGLA